MPLKRAVTEIYQIVDQEKRGDQSSPFFFIVGAGVSYPEVPLACDIEKHCRDEAKKYDDSPDPDVDRPIDSYSQWFKRGYPSARKRQRYLRSIMEETKISRANLRLARLVLTRTIARTVFTTNFDDMLSKALALFGERPLVCDHPQTVRRMDIDSSDLQIIHVHGSYWFYDCCNLTQEIVDRSVSAPMSVMLEQFLLNHSPLVVGYSGWEGDILMTSLQRRLAAGNLGTPLYWFCYRRDALKSLPEWLRNHSDVNFVVPDEQPSPAAAISSGVQPLAAVSASASAVQPDTSAKTATDPLEARTKAADPVKGGELLAERVFQEMMEQFRLPIPPLMQNPLDFFVSQLQQSFDATDLEDATSKDSFRTVIRRVERARDAEPKEGPSSLKPLRDAMAKADHRGALRVASGIDLVALPANERREALFMIMEAALGLYDNSPEELAGYEMVTRLGDLISKQDQDDPDTREQVAKALFCRAGTLENLHRNQEALAIYDGLIDRFIDNPTPSIRVQVAKALFSKGAILNSLNRYDDAIRAYDELLKHFDEDADKTIRENLAKGMFNKAYSLVVLNRHKEGVKAYGDLLKRFADSTEPALREQVAKSLLNRALALSTLEMSEEEMADYDDLLRRFADAPEPALRERVARGMLYKGVTLAMLKRNQEAVDVYDDLANRFSESQEPVIREQVAKAIFSKGYVLGTMERSEDEMEAYDEVIRRFGEATEPVILEQVAKALYNKAATLSSLDRKEQATVIYDDLIRRFADSKEPAIREQVARAFLSKANLCETAGDLSLAIGAYEETITRFGDTDDATLSEFVSRARAKLEALEEAGQHGTAALLSHANGH
jgi:tetratricopeptide (TPR) repeat protein